jgi:hypothetical protein
LLLSMLMSTCHGSEVVLTMCLPLSMLLSRDKRCKVMCCLDALLFMFLAMPTFFNV